MENKNESISVIETTGVDSFESQERAAIDIQIATAKRYPRNVSECIKEAGEIACLDEETARGCRYALPRAGKAITGPSVVAAKIAAQSWGNMRIHAIVKQITDTQVVCEAVAFDLQKNLAVKVEVRKSIVGKYGKYSADMITMTGNAASSIALRNAIFSVIPKNAIGAIMKRTKALIIGELDTAEKIEEKANKIFAYYKKTYNTTEKEFLKLINRAAFKEITTDDIVILYDFFEALKAGDATAEVIFGRNKQSYDKKKKDLKKKPNPQNLNLP